MYGYYDVMDPESAAGISNLSIQYIERPFLKWKDKWFPPSPEKLNKRIATYVDLYVNGGESAIPIIWDAIKQGGNANLSVKTENGSEPVIVKAARYDAFFLVQALQAAGADLNARDSNGETALIVSARKGGLEISSFLIEAGADVTAVEKTNRDALFMAEASGQSQIAKMLKSALSFNAAAQKEAPGEEKPPVITVAQAKLGAKPAA